MARCIFKIVLLLIACATYFQNIVLASEEDLRQEIAALKAKLAEVDQLKVKVAELEKQVGEQKCSILAQAGTVNEVRQSLQQAVPAENLIKYAPGEGVTLPCGFKIQADATFIMQGTPNANNAGDSRKSRCDASWSADIFIEKFFDDWGLAFMHLEPGQANTLEDKLSVYSNVNRDANDTGANVPVTELWYEHYFFNKQLTMTGGKLDPENYLDQNAYAHDETTQFLGRMFRASPAVEWPNDNTLGASIAAAPEFLPYIVISASYFNADNSYQDIFNKPFISTELTLRPSKLFGYDDKMWDGNYRAYFWYNGLDHPKLIAQGESTDNTVKERNYGIGLSFDQMVTDNFGVFSRLGWQRPDVTIAGENHDTAPIEGAWSAGLQINGKIWKREDDVLAFAFGQVFPSKEYKDAGNGGVAEDHFETYYKIKLTKNLAISPDIQVIWNPRGISESYQGGDDPIFVYGARGQLDF